jgi:hypothetical protein
MCCAGPVSCADESRISLGVSGKRATVLRARKVGKRSVEVVCHSL